MKDMTRAIRRRHVARLKKKRSSYFVVSWWERKDYRLGRIVQYPKMCSCPMCGNPRKWDKSKYTIHELQGFDVLRDGMEDLNDAD